MATQHEVFRELPSAFVELLVNVGLMNSVSEQWPDDVQERWTEKLERMRTWALNETSEVQEFASSFD